MNRKINNLEELQQEKARLQLQIQITQAELNASLGRTREELKILVEDKFSLSKQVGQLFQGGASQVAQAGAVGAISRLAGQGTWWGGIVSSLLPIVVDMVRRQFERRKKRRAEKPETDETAVEKPKSRRLFRRKSAEKKEG